MSIQDPLGDMLTRIRNAQERGKPKVACPASKLRGRVLDVLKQEGFIRDYAMVQKSGAKAEFEIDLKYFDGAPVIREIHRVSKPGRRIYASVETLPTVYNGLGISIVSTSQGIMTGNQARKNNVGGELVCYVW